MRHSVGPRPSVFALTAVLLIASLVAAHPGGQEKPSGAQKSIVVMVLKTPRRVVYKVNSRTVRDLLRALGQQLEERGQDCPVIVLVDSDVPIRQIFDVEITADKAGFKNVRSFVYDPDNKTYMSQIQIVRGLPFSTNPD
jgi:biopolymer transport protein ExbD